MLVICDAQNTSDFTFHIQELLSSWKTLKYKVSLNRAIQQKRILAGRYENLISFKTFPLVVEVPSKYVFCFF